MSDAHKIQRRALGDCMRWLGSGSEGARFLELPGVCAAVAPAAPRRSLVNGVVYEDAAALAAGYDEVARAYADAGIIAWTVWTPDSDLAGIEHLANEGHALDGKPVAMILDLDRLQVVPAGDLEWGMQPAFDELGSVNDRAYGYEADGMAAAITRASGDLPIRVFQAHRHGEVASVLATVDHEDDLGIYFVATLEAHRGQGLTSRLLSIALADARDRGLSTSSLQSSALGANVYRRLGYESHFSFHLYERRTESL